jgi:hypothetical protein
MALRICSPACGQLFYLRLHLRPHLGHRQRKHLHLRLEVSQDSVCEPAMAPRGEHRPTDYPHGLRIFVDHIQHDPHGLTSTHVVTDDLTTRPAEHVAVTLRRRTYHFRKSEAGEWQIADYTKEYDSNDAKAGYDCKQALTATK